MMPSFIRTSGRGAASLAATALRLLGELGNLLMQERLGLVLAAYGRTASAGARSSRLESLYSSQL